jgi:hypothetical protein
VIEAIRAFYCRSPSDRRLDDECARDADAAHTVLERITNRPPLPSRSQCPVGTDLPVDGEDRLHSSNAAAEQFFRPAQPR